MSDITVEAVVSLKLKLPPESAAIISEIVVGDRVFTPSGEHHIQISTKLAADVAEQPENRKADDRERARPEVKISGKLSNRICENKTCKKSFVPKNVRSRFCSNKCANEVYQANYFAKQKSSSHAAKIASKKKPSFGASGAASDTPVGTRPLNLGDPAAPRSYARQGD